jgi:hypothetical protein
MRAREFLFENIDLLKNKVKDLISVTSDETLLNKIYTALNSETLLNRLSKGLEALPDVEIRSFIDDISNAIVQAPGSYEEKIAFVEGLEKGFIDVDKMVDGSRHHFSDLLMPSKTVSLSFLFKMFNALKDIGGRVKKGPGEFAIAIMSPKVRVFGGGDLKITTSKNPPEQTVEVKAGHGTIGATGLFQHQKVPIILQQYLPDINLNQNIGATALFNAIKTANLDPNTLQEFANKLVDYIFKAQLAWTNTEPLKQAIINAADNSNPEISDKTKADNIRKGYLIAAYSAYKKGGNDSKFHGVMLIDFERQELRYFDDPEELFKDIDTPKFNLYSTNKEWGGKLISPGVRLRSQQLVKPDQPDQFTPDTLQQYVQQQAEYLIRAAQQKNPQDLDLRNPLLLADVSATMSDLIDQKFKGNKLTAELLKRFPMLKVRGAAPAPANTAAAPANAAPASTNAAQPVSV